MARPHGTKKRLSILKLFYSEINMAGNNPITSLKQVEEILDSNVLTIKESLKDNGYELVRVWALKKL